MDHPGSVDVSPEIFRLIAEHGAFWEEWFDTEERLCWVSPGVEGVIGYTPDECLNIADYPLSIVHPDDRQIIDDMRQKVFTVGHCRDVTLRIVHKDGDFRIISVNCLLVYGNDKDVLGYRVSAREVTEQLAFSNAQEKLRSSESRFRGLFKDAPLGYQSLDADGRIVEVNNAWLNLMGYQHDEVINKWFGDFLTPESQAIVEEQFPMLKQCGEVQGAIFDLITATDQIITVSLFGKAMYDEQGKFDRSHCIIEDITKRREAERALQASERKFKTLVESVGAAQWSLDLATQRFTYVGPQLEAMLGYPIDTWEDMGVWVKRLHPDDRAQAVKYCQTCTARGEDHEFEYRALHLDGRVIWIRDIVTVVNKGGKPVELIGFMLDITKMKVAEAEREQLIHELQGALSDVKQLSGMLPICSSCKNIRNDEGYWHQIERYFVEHSELQFTHSICPDCMRELYPDLVDELQPDSKE